VHSPPRGSAGAGTCQAKRICESVVANRLWIADPYENFAASRPPSSSSRCDPLAQFCPPPPPTFHEQPYSHHRTSPPSARPDPPLFAAPPAHQGPSLQQQLTRHQRILLFLRHCAKCQDPTRCAYGAKCQTGKQLWSHIFQCSNPRCSYRNCVYSRELLRHYQKCVDHNCPICGPVRSFVASDQGSGTVPF
jgi:TAZ zinc finger